MNLYKAVQVPVWQISRLGSAATVRSWQFLAASKLSTNTSILDFKEQKDLFNNAMPGIMNSLITRLEYKGITDTFIHNWVKEVFDYNLTGGKQLRGLTTVMAYETFVKSVSRSEESLQLSRVLGWCVEMLHASIIILDDIMDRSMIRRNAPTWHSLHHVGLGAINDSILINTCTNGILRSQCGHLPQYLNFMDAFNEASLCTYAGQHLDNCTEYDKQNNFHLYTAEHYNTIVKYKTSEYSVILPFRLGLILANNNDEKTNTIVTEICYILGYIYQMQNDFTDVFELDSITGKSGTDIQEGKCTWLAVTALKHCNDTQRKEFLTYYGSSEPSHIEKIKRLYEELNLPEIYRQEECTRYDEVLYLANSLDNCTRASDLFSLLLNLTIKRKI